MLSDAQLRVLLALVALRERQPSVSVRDVSRALGRNPATVYRHLANLRARGFVDWEPGQGGTLRPLVFRVR